MKQKIKTTLKCLKNIWDNNPQIRKPLNTLIQSFIGCLLPLLYTLKGDTLKDIIIAMLGAFSAAGICAIKEALKQIGK